MKRTTIFFEKNVTVLVFMYMLQAAIYTTTQANKKVLAYKAKAFESKLRVLSSKMTAFFADWL